MFLRCIVFEFIFSTFKISTFKIFEGRTLQFFAFGSLLVPPQTLYLLFRVSDSFDRKLEKKIENFEKKNR